MKYSVGLQDLDELLQELEDLELELLEELELKLELLEDGISIVPPHVSIPSQSQLESSSCVITPTHPGEVIGESSSLSYCHAPGSASSLFHTFTFILEPTTLNRVHIQSSSANSTVGFAKFVLSPSTNLLI